MVTVCPSHQGVYPNDDFVPATARRESWGISLGSHPQAITATLLFRQGTFPQDQAQSLVCFESKPEFTDDSAATPGTHSLGFSPPVDALVGTPNG